MSAREGGWLYRIAGGAEAPRIPRGLTLISTIPGAIDAGRICAVTERYLHDSLEHRRVVTFNSDELIDFRSSRPQGQFDGRGFSLEAIPEFAIDLMWDDAGAPFLLLFGPEPDLRWNALSESLVDVCETFAIDTLISLRSVPAEVPHTRVIAMIPHANAPARAHGAPTPSCSQPIDVPVSFGAFVEVRMERAVIPSRGFVAQVPHYLTRTSFPAGALALLRRVSEIAELQLPLADLGDVVAVSSRVIDSDVEENEELGRHIEALEEAYDAVRAQAGEGEERTVLDTPTAEEIGESLERFLAESTNDSRFPHEREE